MILLFLTIAQLRNNYEVELLMASLLVIADMHADPTLNPRNDADVRCNDAQRRTRIVIERCFGVLERRFPCLHK